MGVQLARGSLARQRLEQHAPVVRVVVLEPGEIDERRTDVGVVGEDRAVAAAGEFTGWTCQL